MFPLYILHKLIILFFQHSIWCLFDYVVGCCPLCWAPLSLYYPQIIAPFVIAHIRIAPTLNCTKVRLHPNIIPLVISYFTIYVPSQNWKKIVFTSFIYFNKICKERKQFCCTIFVLNLVCNLNKLQIKTKMKIKASLKGMEISWRTANSAKKSTEIVHL